VENSFSAFSVSRPGLCAYLSLQMKAIKPHLTLLMSSSNRLFIICSSQSLMGIVSVLQNEKHSGDGWLW
jgi:hypothetical protein